MRANRERRRRRKGWFLERGGGRKGSHLESGFGFGGLFRQEGLGVGQVDSELGTSSELRANSLGQTVVEGKQ